MTEPLRTAHSVANASILRSRRGSSSRRDTTKPPTAVRYAQTCGVAGLAFAALFVIALLLVHRAPALGVPDSAYNAFYRVGDGKVLVTVGLYIVPFAGIAFLWHISTTRALIEASGSATSDLPKWMHLAAGVLFIGMLFAGTAASCGVALLTVFSSAPLPAASVARALAGVGYGLVFVFGVRAAGVYMMTTTTLMRGTGVMPRWLSVLSYLAALFLLASTTFHPAIVLVFPGWMTLMSVALLARGGRSLHGRSEASESLNG